MTPFEARFFDPKIEGAVIHPDEFEWKCDCDKCKARYERQLEAWLKQSHIKRMIYEKADEGIKRV